MSDSLEQVVRNAESGSTVAGMLLLPTSIATAVAGSYVGEGAGYVFGQLMDFLPYARDLAPWLAERSGLLTHVANQAGFNVDFYQATGALGGLVIGLAAPAALYALSKIDGGIL